MNKKLFRRYTTYGKSDNESIADEYVIDDTEETRREIIEDHAYYDFYEDVEFFIDGSVDGISYGCSGGDWDDPTGGSFVLLSEEQLRYEADEKYKRDINSIENYFKEEN